MTYEIIDVTTEKIPNGNTVILAKAHDANKTVVVIIYNINGAIIVDKEYIKSLLDKEYEKVREIKYKPKFNVNVGDIL